MSKKKTFHIPKNLPNEGGKYERKALTGKPIPKTDTKPKDQKDLGNQQDAKENKE